MFSFCVNGYSQAISNIPAELLENAYSVVVNNELEFVCESNRNGVHKETYIVTILNEKGKNAGHFLEYCDKYTSLRKFSGEVFDGTGKSIRKIKKSDLQMSEYSNGLSTDDYMYFYECNAPYPYTVKYEWEVKRNDGIISYPIFAPQTDFNQSVVKATYRLIAAPGIEPRYHVFHSGNKPQETKVANGTQYELSFNNLKAYESESYGPSLTQLSPYAFFNPTDFFFDNTTGTMKSWQDYGVWAYKLLENRDALPAPFQQRIKDMTANCETNREKVKVLYDFLANNTRYVSIQLGIGGFQPIPAMDVNKTGFGDCKGLSNYLKAMLNVIGIPSNYTEISTRNRRIMKDYVSLNQTNHVILQVPLEGDTLWLECTNAKLPFGYVHSDIAGHDAILITATGGQFCTLPSYPDSLNMQTTVAEVVIDATGKAIIDAKQTSYLAQYENTIGIQQLEPTKQRDRIRAGISLSQATVSNLQITEHNSNNPSVELSYKIDTNQYGNKTGNRLFVPTNIFRRGFKNLPKTRQHDIYVKYGYLDTDSINITIPEGYTVESLAAPFILEGKFGKFEAIHKREDNKLTIIHRLYFKSGKYSKAEYGLFNAFCSMISKQYDGKIVLRKE
ncbi:DUF3857 domain-containing protein [Bacteroides sp. 519]|nr:DUF3857 domain-containing protein [Bacteroides sp. 519]